MAMLRVGKLIFRFKDGGIDYRWGDGEKRRIGFNRKKTDAENTDLYPDDYVENADTSDLNYDGRFSDGDDGYADEDYAICLKKGNDALQDAVNQALSELIEDGTVQAIIDKYIPSK